MKKSIATVCLSGTLVQKMHACAAAGFDGIEIFEPDLVTSPQTPEEIRALADRLGLTLDLYQPFRDFEGVDETLFADNLRRAEAKFGLMNRLGIDTMLVCSNVATATIDDDSVSAAQLRALGDLAQTYGVRIAFEALAWGRFVSDYRRAWRIVELADHPHVGTCLDSFHVLSRGHDPSEIERIPADKIFYLQLADAPALSMDVLSWSRHHRLFPGEGSFELVDFVAHVLRTGYDGPLSLEVFNDTFRQTDVARTAMHARRSLIWLEDAAARRLGGSVPADMSLLTDAKPPTGFDFVEVKSEDTDLVDIALRQLGFTFRGRHRSKPVRLWTSGDARIVLNEQQARDLEPFVAAIGFDVGVPDATAARAHELIASPVFRRTYGQEVALEAIAAPDATEIFLCEAPVGPEAAWVGEFEGGEEPAADELISHIDHVNLAQPWQNFDEAVLFYGSTLGMEAQPTTEVAGPVGLVRSQVMRSADGAVRLPLNVAPLGAEDDRPLPQHIAFACRDVVQVARRARDRGMRFLPVPGNYYEDLSARFGLPDDFVAQLKAYELLYDRDADGEFLHFYTETIGAVFFEFVERRGGYDGYGAANAPVRLAAQFGEVLVAGGR